MDKKQIDFIKTNKRFQKDWDYYTNYFIFIFPLGILIIGLSMIYSVVNYDNTNLIFLGLGFVTISVAFGFFTLQRLIDVLRFECIEIGFNKNEIDNLAQKIKSRFRIRSLEIDDEKRFIKIYTKWSAFSWGEEITLIIDNNQILINSKPTSIRQPVTIYKDRQNIKIIKELIKE
jgi:hypothetical protein